MAKAHQRPKQPEFLRASLIAATAELLAGGAAVSIGAVAEAAGVSKGAVQHHFGSRDELFQALYDELCTEFETSLAQVPPSSTAAWAYANAALRNAEEAADSTPWRALLVALVVDRSLAERWASWVAQSRTTAEPESTEQLVARLVADGLWLSDLLGIYKITDAERARLSSHVQQLAETKPK